MTNTEYFDGATFDAKLDGPRLTTQLEAVRMVISGGGWWTLSDISTLADAPQSSVSARLRDLRKPRFGKHTVERRRVADAGTYEYRMAA